MLYKRVLWNHKQSMFWCLVLLLLQKKSYLTTKQTNFPMLWAGAFFLPIIWLDREKNKTERRTIFVVFLCIICITFFYMVFGIFAVLVRPNIFIILQFVLCISSVCNATHNNNNYISRYKFWKYLFWNQNIQLHYWA